MNLGGAEHLIYSNQQAIDLYDKGMSTGPFCTIWIHQQPPNPTNTHRKRSRLNIYKISGAIESVNRKQLKTRFKV